MGTGLVTGNTIPCSFNNMGNAKCILRKSEVANTPAVIEVINFDAITAGATIYTIRLTGIKNPINVSSNVVLTIKVNTVTVSN